MISYSYITVKLNRASALLLKIRNFVKMKKKKKKKHLLCNIRLPSNIFIFVCAKNSNTVNRLIIHQKRALRIMNFKDHLFHSNPHFFTNIILKFGDTLANILFVNNSINRWASPIFYDWFKLSRNLHRYDICWSVNDDLRIPTF